MLMKIRNRILIFRLRYAMARHNFRHATAQNVRKLANRIDSEETVSSSNGGRHKWRVEH